MIRDELRRCIEIGCPEQRLAADRAIRRAVNGTA
jgi:hypothetical protein